jgi:tellurite resistance protein TehA-like permease
VTMGTGIVSVLLNSIPYHGDWLFYLSMVFFVLNLILFTLCFFISFARYTLYPEIWSVMIRDPTNSLFLACAPMGFATLLEMALVGVPGWGNGFLTFIWALWIVDAVCAVASTLSLCFILSVTTPSLSRSAAI